MSKYAIDRACGHQQDVQIYGTNVNGERERKAAWLATQPCPACAAAQREGQHATQNAAAAEWAAGLGLPALEGTPKQAAWAESIRRECLEDLFAGTRSSHQRAGHPQDVTEHVIAIYLRAAARITSATAWIEAPEGARALLRDHVTQADRDEAKALVAK